MSRRAPGKDLPWHDYPDLLCLPNKALDVNARKAPAGLRMFFLPLEPQESLEECSSPKIATPGKEKNDKK